MWVQMLIQNQAMFEEMKQGIGIFKAGQIPDMGLKLKS